METKFASHCSYKIRYHMVMCVKYRKQLLNQVNRVEKLKQIIKEIGERYWFETDEMGTDGDHVHIFVGAAPRYAPSRIMQIIKSISAKQIFQMFPEIRKVLWGGEFWSDGGYIGTVGDQANAEIVRKYIQQQGDRREKEQYNQLKLFKF
ncbi:IS200/IS605 family transposase [bacterium (Candidatus Gribaldobacteria) CG02_land_8_20_14_3_00_41_15]|uniref:IS200/IS605 family transposase n=1 Tax=bacterium (Candidatus Gribaldobacteria) CG02_land_8_20_14_3_00_41_15 TaxID=2014270 RepID=A0A2M7DDM6_9BACT|nr:MAG: IS200/IS605 family transposase [bacterium (Candidatus Gribaldobacteria) CG02_land_8_20_14_3_00_41_15]